MKNTKKVLALILGCAMLLGILAGCGDKNNGNDETVPGNNNYDIAEISGSILLNANACVEIAFDDEGNVLNLQEVDHDGHELLADYSGYLNTPCADVVKELVAISSNLELLSDEHNHIVIKQLPKSELPSETFLTDLAAAAKDSAEISVTVSVVTAEEVDAEGNILAKRAYDLLQTALNVDHFELIESNEELTDGVYAFNVVAGALEGVYLVEAATGYVYEGSFEVADPDLAETVEDEAIVDVETTSNTEATQPVSNEALPEDTASHEETTAPAE